MQRIINDPMLVVEDMLQGFTKAYPHLVAKTENPRVLKFAGAPVANKVGIVTGGGSGHKPAFIGYVGKNLCDAVAVGDTPYDAEAAKKAGVPTIGVLCGGFNEGDLRKAGCVEVYPGPAALLACFARSLLAK